MDIVKTTLAILTAALLLFISAKQESKIFLFSYFKNNGEDGLHLAYSEDGYTWTALNNNTSVLTPEVGRDRLMRDPCIIRGGDGKFHMVWTVSWGEKGIGYANSADLINWSEQQYIPVMHHELEAQNCWAPELFYDDVEERYMIYWSTTIPGRFPETDSSGDKGRNHRIYYTTTKDFEKFASTQLLYDPGFNVIDATIQKINEEYVMFVKDETKYPKPEKNIKIAKSASLTGDYSAASGPITPNYWVEGPTVTNTENGWIMYFDKYRKGAMGAVISTDLEHWTDVSNRIHFPAGTRHGTVLKVSKSIVRKLQQRY